MSMGKALYRKYRPTSLAEVVGQEHITKTLANAIKSGKISHAYLLTGPRGVGKTSIARILAHQLNDLAYDETQAHLDIIEIDAASNRRIDEIRDLRDKVHVLPAVAKYKVYIIDEVHMLTREAFNALLKTLEEPPAHVIFVLATTEAHKLPETIVSRTQHFSFKPIEISTLVNHLKTIATSEKMNIDDDAIELVAVHGDGSFRDSISLLDQVRGINDHITKLEVQQLLGIAPAEALEKLISLLQAGTASDLFTLLSELRSQGLQAGSVASQLSERLRELIISDKAYQNIQTTKLLHDLLSVGSSNQPDRVLELVLLDFLFANNPLPKTQEAAAQPVVTQSASITTSSVSPEVVAIPAKQPEASAEKSPKQKVEKPVDTKEAPPKVVEKKDPEATSTEPKTAAQPVATGTFDVAAWPVVLAAIKKKYNTLYGILRMAIPSSEGSTLTLACKFAFHQKQINESKNRKIISDIITEQTGETVEIVCVINKDDAAPAKSTNNNDITNVSDIFGGAEVLES